MVKMLKKMKLNELQKENFSSKGMQKITGGDQVCGCGYSCLDWGSEAEKAVGSLAWENKYCGCN